MSILKFDKMFKKFAYLFAFTVWLIVSAAVSYLPIAFILWEHDLTIWPYRAILLWSAWPLYYSSRAIPTLIKDLKK